MKRVSLLAVALLVVIMASVVAQAHEVRPGYLELRQTGPQSYDVFWKVPARGDKRLGLYVGFPDHCSGSEPPGRFSGGAYVTRWQVHCTRDLVGAEIRIDGLDATRTDVLARVEHAGGVSQTVRLTPDAPVFRVSTGAGPWQVIKTYCVLGVEHILLGIDHLLFVLALLFLVGNWLRLIGTITAFTVAHSLTLAAATLGWVQVAQAPVEAAIALSIVFVAVEVLHARQGRPGLAARKPWLVAFVFGLLHGLGFAGALHEVGLPEQAIPLALAFFNVGVEVGQILFVAAVFVVFSLFNTLQTRAAAQAATGAWRGADAVSRPAAYVIGTLAAFWVFERTAGFWS